jgi:hypothetical protein
MDTVSASMIVTSLSVRASADVEAFSIKLNHAAISAAIERQSGGRLPLISTLALVFFHRQEPEYGRARHCVPDGRWQLELSIAPGSANRELQRAFPTIALAYPREAQAF